MRTFIAAAAAYSMLAGSAYAQTTVIDALVKDLPEQVLIPDRICESPPARVTPCLLPTQEGTPPYRIDCTKAKGLLPKIEQLKSQERTRHWLIFDSWARDAHDTRMLNLDLSEMWVQQLISTQCN